MTRLELFEIWAPPSSPWTRWVKPAVFASLDPGAMPALTEDWARLDIQEDASLAVVIDLPGPDSMRAGMGLAEDGYRPIPLFNTALHPNAVIRMEVIAKWLAGAAPRLLAMNLPPAAPPAFLLDSMRLGKGLSPRPGDFDNRWMTFPQDFPSAGFLKSHGLRRALLLQETEQPAEDLAHILLRWQEAGIEIFQWHPSGGGQPRRIEVAKPRGYRVLWQRALAAMGFRRSMAGGFGAVVPQPSSGSG